MAIFNLFRRKTEDKVNTLITRLDIPYFPVHNPQNDPSVSNTNPPTFRAMFAYNRALKAIVAIGNPAIEHLTNALNHPNLNVRLGVITALGKIGDLSAMETLMAVIRTKKSHERAYAVSALGKIDRADILEQIILYLHDPDVEVREAAVSALGEMGDPRALSELEIIAHSDHALIDRYGPSISELAEKAIKKISKHTGSS